MAIFNSYVSLPEGKFCQVHVRNISAQQAWPDMAQSLHASYRSRGYSIQLAKSWWRTGDHNWNK
jgi:hypothetical protein